MTADPTARPASLRLAHAGVEAERVDAGHLERRRLCTGTAGWLLLAGLGVSAVTSGDHAGWNSGPAEGGSGGLLIATVLMAVTYTAVVLGPAELGSALPTAGGYTVARRALVPRGGYATVGAGGGVRGAGRPADDVR